MSQSEPNTKVLKKLSKRESEFQTHIESESVRVTRMNGSEWLDYE